MFLSCSTEEAVSVTSEIAEEAVGTQDPGVLKDHAGLGRTAQKDATKTEIGKYFITPIFSRTFCEYMLHLRFTTNKIKRILLNIYNRLIAPKYM